jgi:hypothetical protein
VYQDERVSYRLIQGESVLVSSQVDFDERGGTIYQYTNRNGVTKYFQHPDASSPTVVTFGSGGSARFDRFVQLTGAPGRPHLVEPGDSGSLLVRRDPDGLKAVALVFAGSHNRVAVYPIRTVLRRLGQAAASRNGQSENVGIEYG